eukprot:15330037-Ditylum_brightwellii.AAC.1
MDAATRRRHWTRRSSIRKCMLGMGAIMDLDDHAGPDDDDVRPEKNFLREDQPALPVEANKDTEVDAVQVIPQIPEKLAEKRIVPIVGAADLRAKEDRAFNQITEH